MKKKLLVVCGPTATGKTGLGIKLAKKFSGEIVSVDSRQVYRGMDIGTGKDTGEAKFVMPAVRDSSGMNNLELIIKNSNYQLGYYLVDGVKVWLLDVVEPDFRFTVADYVKCARVVVRDIWDRGKLPIIVGGTGFYIKALVDGVETIGVPPNLRLRDKLTKRSVAELQKELEILDPFRIAKMNASDRQNPRRLIRAVEIAHWQLEYPASSVGEAGLGGDYLFIGLKASFKKLYEQIDQRVEMRLEQGLEKEIKGLLDKGYTWTNSVLGETLGYQEWQSSKSKEKVIEEWKFNEHAYARRQMTWFSRNKRIHWFDIAKRGFDKEVQKLVQKWYRTAHAKKD